MAYESRPASPDAKRYTHQEYFKLAHETLRFQNDEREEAIRMSMIEKTKLEVMENTGDSEQELIGGLLGVVAILAGMDSVDDFSQDARYCPRNRLSKSRFLLFEYEQDRRDDLNQAVEMFGLELNGYNQLFIDYIDNFVIYNPDIGWDITPDEIIDIIYTDFDQETHLHPTNRSDPNIGCPVCICSTLKKAFKMPADARQAYLQNQENERNFWLQLNIAT